MKIGAITLTLAFSMAFAFLVLAGMPPASDAGPCPSTLDADGIGDCIDNCTTVDNVAQTDTNSDGYGNFCDPDIDNDGTVGSTDLATLKTFFLVTTPPASPDIDFDGDGTVGSTDLAILKGLFLLPPGPSGLACAGTVPCP